jgi:hypothetical protein
MTKECDDTNEHRTYYIDHRVIIPIMLEYALRHIPRQLDCEVEEHISSSRSPSYR